MSHFPNGSPWFIVNNVFWQYCCVSWVLMEPEDLKRDTGNLSVKLEIFLWPTKKFTKIKDIYKEKRFWTKPLIFLQVYLIFIGFIYQVI